MKDGIGHSDPFIANYCKYLKSRKKAIGTITVYAKAIHKFWLYCLYFPPSVNEDFFDYMIQYENIITTKGFSIYKNTKFCSGIDSVFSSNAYKKVKNPKTDFVALQSFFTFVLNKKLNTKFDIVNDSLLYAIYYGDTFNYKKLVVRNRYSKGASYGLKVSPEMKTALLERVNILDVILSGMKSPESGKMDNNSVFPLAAFDALLSVASTRNKLYYLLCGATSARASQALCFTRFDVNIKDREIYLVNPRGDNDNGFVKMPRNEMLKQYGIDFNLKPYRSIGFKYSIPASTSGIHALTFLPTYESIFFKTYFAWDKNMSQASPMVFQTFNRNGDVGLLRYSNIYDNFKADIEKVKKKYPNLKKNLDSFNNGLHGLRHMYGCAMADYIYYIDLPENKKIRDEIGWDFTKNESKDMVMSAMGHSTEKENKKYFKKSRFVYADIKRRFKKDKDHVISHLKKIQIHSVGATTDNSCHIITT